MNLLYIVLIVCFFVFDFFISVDEDEKKCEREKEAVRRGEARRGFLVLFCVMFEGSIVFGYHRDVVRGG